MASYITIGTINPMTGPYGKEFQDLAAYYITLADLLMGLRAILGEEEEVLRDGFIGALEDPAAFYRELEDAGDPSAGQQA